MDEYELLLNDVINNVPVVEMELLRETGLKAAYKDNYIYLDKHLSAVEKRVNLSEEYSHHKTSVGNIIDYNDPKNRKQEWQARRDSVERLVSLDDLIECSFASCKNRYECAEYLGITEEFLKEVLVHYYTKYGPIYLYENYIFIFNDESMAILDTGILENQHMLR